MPSYTGHLEPARCCSLCGAYYRDGSDHGHTAQSCYTTLRERFDKLQRQCTEVYLYMVEAETRLGKEGGTKALARKEV